MNTFCDNDEIIFEILNEKNVHSPIDLHEEKWKAEFIKNKTIQSFVNILEKFMKTNFY